ncbi:hypothetical protein SPRG_16356 [Saprolegnia parasitica CBS 223.65]|uniref:DJ-1/PfpI domain-containing protein n=1 Tax=Saprolegnia parasitica (strain CBS 223.65) TaxID=695850 RepID=A0A067BIC3_SAPPC|nr:hypothetical protein SPRG_16356 [Saprolegnia parasitica CBS 223.65]KDO18149.1 hypothetical protein SPRG_16356 [Saprolegnia parasitica CBS 223.65]|eukprot:XP_012211150.1 hypothetical protein SPRG_16356 [Saprolegnia parasitica CBS 223.65]
MPKLTVGVLLFDGYTIMDVAGPLQLFDMLPDVFDTVTISQHAGTMWTNPPMAGTPMVASHSFESAPRIDILLLPGGLGTDVFAKDPAYLAFVRARAESATYILSVCTGSSFLAASGLLDGKRATTNKLAFQHIQSFGSSAIQWVKQARWVVDGNIWTSSGVTAGIDMAAAFLTSVVGTERVKPILELIEYVPSTNESHDPFSYLTEHDHWAVITNAP